MTSEEVRTVAGVEWEELGFGRWRCRDLRDVRVWILEEDGHWWSCGSSVKYERMEAAMYAAVEAAREEK